MNNFELEETISDMLYTKYIKIIIDRLYKKELINGKEHEVLIKECDKRIKKCLRKSEVLNGNKK